MLPLGYNPEAYGGRVWWNEDNPEMRAIWGTQEDYDNHIKNGGTWDEYAEERMALREMNKDKAKKMKYIKRILKI